MLGWYRYGACCHRGFGLWFPKPTWAYMVVVLFLCEPMFAPNFHVHLFAACRREELGTEFSSALNPSKSMPKQIN